MSKLFRSTALPLALAAVMTLSACKTDEEKAAEYFESGQALLAAGDEDRAMVEFRNVFKYDPFHFEARKTYADILVKDGELEEAYGQLLRLVEQYPDTADARVTLAELAIGGSNWEEAERHGTEAIRLAPNDPRVQVIGLMLDYRQANLDKDDAALAKVAEAAGKALEAQPESEIARRIVIDQLASGPEPMKALPFVDGALALKPMSLEYQMMKYLLLAQGGDEQATGEQLKTMFGLFPDNTEVRAALIRWYMQQKDFDGAESFLRQVAGDATGPVEPHLGLLQFLQVQKGTEAARAELEILLAANGEGENAQMYGAMLASMDYDAGKPDQAIAAMRDIVAKAEASPATDRIKGMLARALDGRGDREGASVVVEEILKADHNNAVALKLRARWALEQDRIAPAIQDLNAALTNAPRDPEIFNLLAVAQQRDGNLQSAGEYLAQAVQASGLAPTESLRYANYQISTGDLRQAENTLAQAWAVSPSNQDILRALADLFISQEKWPEAQTALDFLKETDAKGAAQIEATILDATGKGDEALSVLKTLIDQEKDVPANAQSVLRILLRKNDTAAARTFINTLQTRFPDDRDLRLLSAGLHVQEGQVETAIATYRDLIAQKPDDEPPVRLLYGVLARDGRTAEATEVLDAGLSAMPGMQTLLWLKASEQERDGQIDGAIASYEQLYAMGSDDILVANNLASLLANHNPTPENLVRAEAISRRLRGQDIPAFQDTYGWIAFLTGNTYGAIADLEPAAKGLPDDALTQYHLGKLYQSMARTADAVAQYEKALALAAKSPVLSALPQIADAKDQHEKLKAELEKANSP